MASHYLTFGILKIDPKTPREIFIAGNPVRLTRREKEYLLLLAKNPGKTFSQVEMLAALYRGKAKPEKKIVDVIVCKIRKKTSIPGHPVIIETEHGKGYKLEKTLAKARA